MLPSRYVQKQAVLPSLSARTRSDALSELIDALLKGKAASLRATVLDQVVSRESLESTAIGRGIAVPHARVREIDDLICAIGVSKKGLEFKAIDGAPVHVVFLMVYPPKRQSTYLNFVSSVAGVLRDDAATSAIRSAKEPDHILAALDELSQRVAVPETLLNGRKKGKVQLEAPSDLPTELLLLARLDLCAEMLATSETGREEVERRIDNIRALVAPKLLTHYDKLRRRGGPALVTVEGGVCQGCRMKLASQHLQSIRAKPDVVATCANCQRILYVL